MEATIFGSRFSADPAAVMPDRSTRTPRPLSIGPLSIRLTCLSTTSDRSVGAVQLSGYHSVEVP
jgi:hypothetical protein